MRPRQHGVTLESMVTPTATRRTATDRARAARSGARAPLQPVGPEAAPPAIDLDGAATGWQLALDGAERALRAARHDLPHAEIAERRATLAHERKATADLLLQLARAHRSEPLPWLSPVPLTARMVGLSDRVEACLFDLEGVLTDGGRLQAWAWRTVFQDYFQRLSERTGWRFDRFRDDDYAAYLEGRPRLEGVQAFLHSRGLSLPDGSPGDASDANTAHGLARRKGELLQSRLRPRGVTALGGASRYLQAVGRAGLRRAVISASSSTVPMLELAGIATLVDERVDAEVISSEGLRPRPAPDTLLAACRRLDVDPARAVTFTESTAGVAAGRAAGLDVVGVGAEPARALLERAGAGVVVPSVEVLLDARLRLLPDR